MIKPLPIENFKHYFSQIKPGNHLLLNEIYAKDIVFQDPIHSIQGIENLKRYFGKLNENLSEGSFIFTEEDISGNTAYLTWEMTIKLKKSKKPIKASGISVLVFDEKIIKHRDYFDAGEVFYENIPLLGTIVKFIKRQLQKTDSPNH